MAVTEQQPVIEIKDVTKTYTMGHLEVHALRGLSLSIGEKNWTLGTTELTNAVDTHIIVATSHENGDK